MLLIDIRARDRRSAKEWTSINTAGFWLKVAIYSREMLRTRQDNAHEFATKLRYDQSSCLHEMWFFSMREKYFKDGFHFCINQDYQKATVVEENLEIKCSTSYRTVHFVLANKIEIEATNSFARDSAAAETAPLGSNVSFL